jgi:hypothetical protein
MPVTSVSNVKIAIQTFERAVKRSEDANGNVDIEKLKSEVYRETKSRTLRSAFHECIDTLETKFAKRQSVSDGCSSRIVTTRPTQLTATQATTVFAALMEATKKGIKKIDADGDGKITPEESHDADRAGLADQLAQGAAQVMTGEPEPKPAPPPRPVSGGSRSGC